MSVKDVIKNSVYESLGGGTTMSAKTVILILLIACLMGVYIFLVYKLSSKTAFYSKDLNLTIAGMPVIVAAIMIAMQSNLLVSLGMVGALSIVRFRNALKNPLDLLYLFWAISAGIITGVGLYVLALVLSFIMTLLLFLIDKKEKEEEFYAYENGQLARLSGYYVYYEKNEQMQEYMVEQAPNESVDERNDDRVTSNYRLLVQEKQDTHTKKKLSSALYTACTCLVIAILAAGTVLVRDYDRMQQLESQVHQIAVSVLGQNTETVKVEQVNGEVYPTETKETEVVIDTISESETQTKEIVTSEIVTSEIATTITESTSAVEEKDPEPDTTLGTQDSNGQAGY